MARANKGKKPQQHSDPLDLGGFRLGVGNLELRKVYLERRDEPGKDQEEAEFHFTLGVNRVAQDRVLVEVAVKSDETGPAEFEVAYRVGFHVDRTVDPDPESEFDYEPVLQEITARMGPVVLYPYIRETLSTFSVKAGLSPLVLPVMNVGTLFDPKGIVLPSYAEEKSAEE